MDAATQAAISKAVGEAIAPIAEALKTKATENTTGLPRSGGQSAASFGRVRSAFSVHGRGSDPHGGKGLNFVRFIKGMLMGGAVGMQCDFGRAAENTKEFANHIDDRETKESYELVAKALGESNMIDGGALTPDEFSSEFIELLRPATVVRSSGVRVVPMSGASLTMGRQNAAGTAGYVGENVVTNSTQQQFGQTQLQAKKVMAVTPLSNDLIRDAVLSAEMMVRDDLVKVEAITEDAAFIRGSGTVYSPKGVRNWVQAANVFNTPQAGSVATAAEVMQILDYLMAAPEEGNVRLTSAVWWMRPRAKAFLQTLRDSVGGFVFRKELEGPNPTLYGWPVKTTTSIPGNLNELGNSNESEIYFMEAPEVVIGENTQLLVQVFPGGTYNDQNGNLQSGISQDQTVVTIIARHDLIMRHTASGAVAKRCLWGD